MKVPIFKISRPRFWIYLFGPFLIGLAATGQFIVTWQLIVFGFYFLLPANLLIYGINDIFDYETDKNNPKKQSYEHLVKPTEQKKLSSWILLINIPIVVALFFVPVAARWALLAFLFFGLFYSMPPIRAKTKPLFDSIFNILYVFPGVVGYTLISGEWPPAMIILAAGLWCMAMHAYSAILDIAPDKWAKVTTIATKLGARKTLLFCMICYAAASLMVFNWLDWLAILLGGFYLGMMLLSLKVINSGIKNLMKVYKVFPVANAAVGAGLFLWIILVI